MVIAALLLVSLLSVFEFGFDATVKAEEVGLSGILWQDSDFEPYLMTNYPSKDYLTWNTTFGLYTMDKASYLMSLTDRDGVLQVSKSMFWLNTTDIAKVLNPDKILSNYKVLVQNNTCFKIRYAVTTDKEIVGWLAVTYVFFKGSSPKISVSYENIVLTKFNIIWVLLPTLKYLEVSGSETVDFTAKTSMDNVKNCINKEDKKIRVGATASSMNWTSWLSVLWDDSEGVSILYAGVEKVFGGKGLTVVFPANMVLIDPTVAFTTVSVTSVHTCPLDTHTFVIAYSDDTNDDFSFQIYDTNGTQVLAETDVDTTSGGSLGFTSVGVSAFNSTTFVIGWCDNGEVSPDATFAVYNRAGALLSGPTDVDTDVGASSYSVQVSCFNSTHFVIAWFDSSAIQLDITFSVYTSSSTLIAGPIDADTDADTSNSVSVSTFNSTTFVIGWYDNSDGDATFRVYTSAGALLAEADVDTTAVSSRSVSVNTLNSTYFVIGWYDCESQDATFAVYNSAGTLKTGPTDADTTVGTACYSVQVAALNSTAFVISWYDYIDYDLSFATYLSNGTAVAALTDIESWPTFANAPFEYQSPCSQETGTGIKIYNNNWIIAYANTTTQAIWKAFKPDGTAWDGTIPVANTAPTNDACDSTATFTVNVDAWVNMTVSDANLVADLFTVDIQVNTTGDAETFTLRWTQATNVFSEVSDSSGICTLSASSVRANIDTDTDKIAFKFKFTSGKAGNCDVKATTTDDASAADTDTYTNEFSLAFYTELTVVTTTHSWSITPGQSDILITEGTINITVTANANFNVQAKGSGALTYGSYSIALSNVKMNYTGAAISLTTEYQNIPGLTNQTLGTSIAVKFKLWLTAPVGLPEGNYVYTLTIQISQYT
jgi:hypothetical protein